MSDPTPAEIAAGAEALDRLVYEHPRADHEAAARWVLRAVLPDHDARVRAQIAEDIRNHADRYAGKRLDHPMTALRRHLHIAARIAAGPMTPAEVAEALAQRSRTTDRGSDG